MHKRMVFFVFRCQKCQEKNEKLLKSNMAKNDAKGYTINIREAFIDANKYSFLEEIINGRLNNERRQQSLS